MTDKPEESGWQIGKNFYPFVTSFRLGDPVLVEALTGLTWVEFVDRLPDEDIEGQPDDPVVNLGLIGVAVWQIHETWRRDRVVQYVSRLPMEKLEWVGPDEPEEPEDAVEPGEGDARPPAIAGNTTSTSSPPTSKPDSPTTPDTDQGSETSSPTTSGGLTSVM